MTKKPDDRIKDPSSFTAGLIAGLFLSFLLVSLILALVLKGRSFCPLTGKNRATAAPAAPARTNEDPAPPMRGSETAPVTIQEFADFHCGYCKHLYPVLKQVLQNHPDKVRLVFRHFPLAATPGSGSFLTHEASVCAQEQGKFWEFHDAVFSFSSIPKEADLRNMAGSLGLDMTRFENCLKAGRYRNFIQKEVAEGQGKGVSGTPTSFINGRRVVGALPYEQWEKYIETNANPDAAVTASEEGVVHFKDLEGRPSEGPANAPVELVEFGDYHCPFCKKLQPTIDLLMKNYPGKIRHVFRHFPLPFHEGAELTHQASECAHEQGKFWEYHRNLFETETHDSGTLAELAKKTGLDEKKFESCLSSGRTRDLIQKETALGRDAGVEGTPAVFVNGVLVSGAQPYERFEKLIQKQLNKS